MSNAADTAAAPVAPSPAAPGAGPRAKPWVADIAAYVPGKAAGADGRPLVKLSANENPLGCSPLAARAMADAASDTAHYPDPASTALRGALGAKYGIDTDRIICGTGSDELLNLAAGAFAGVGDEVLFVRYGFAVYDIAARRVGATPVEAPDADYGTDVDALLAAITPRTRVIFVANPNNPTGTLASAADIARLHAGIPSDVLFVLDQAYAEFLTPDQDDGGLALALSAPNVLVTRTFSKIYGLAAERIGWATGHPDVIAMMNRIRGPFNVTRCGQAAAVAALGDDAFVDHSRAHNAQWRDWFATEMAGLSNHGVKVVPSATNFVLVLFEGAVDAETVNAALAAGGYAVRHLPSQGLGHGLRVTIGTEEQTRAAAAIIRDAVTAQG